MLYLLLCYKNKIMNSWNDKDLIKFYNFIESKPLRKYTEGWRRITNDPNDEPLNFKSISDLEVIEWFKRENK